MSTPTYTAWPWPTDTPVETQIDQLREQQHARLAGQISTLRADLRKALTILYEMGACRATPYAWSSRAEALISRHSGLLGFDGRAEGEYEQPGPATEAGDGGEGQRG